MKADSLSKEKSAQVICVFILFASVLFGFGFSSVGLGSLCILLLVYVHCLVGFT